jgi:hypothetical protein
MIPLLFFGMIGLASPETAAKPTPIVHLLHSRYQSGPTKVRVHLPIKRQHQERLATLYLLPVEAKDEHRYGDPIAEAIRWDLANRYHIAVVAPTFADLPWYANHPTDPRLQQEKYFLEEVIPLVEANHPVQKNPSGRWLVGFSKSGWGAYSLLLRHPDLFAGALAWDAPLMMDGPGRYGSGPIFGTEENFRGYQVSQLLKDRAAELVGKPRLVLTGYGGFRDQHDAAHRLMNELGIQHIYRDGPERKHDWQSGWLAEGVELLLKSCGRD